MHMRSAPSYPRTVVFSASASLLPSNLEEIRSVSNEYAILDVSVVLCKLATCFDQVHVETSFTNMFVIELRVVFIIGIIDKAGI